MSNSHEPYVTATGMVVDPQRIDIAGLQVFRPFKVRKTQSLARGLASGHIMAHQEVLVAELENGIVVFDKAQLSYYHTAQGEHRGQPWLVCF